jgi:formate-dependent phosphoribosylglycinamide formyltransferase (GAR transformylase)
MKKILIIGAGFLQDFVIQKVKSMGYEALAVDANGDSVGFRNADCRYIITIDYEPDC